MKSHYGCSPVNLHAYFQNTFPSEHFRLAASVVWKMIFWNFDDVIRLKFVKNVLPENSSKHWWSEIFAWNEFIPKVPNHSPFCEVNLCSIRTVNCLNMETITQVHRKRWQGRLHWVAGGEGRGSSPLSPPNNFVAAMRSGIFR